MLFLPGIQNEREWQEFTLDAQRYHQEQLYDEHVRFEEEMVMLYKAFWSIEE